MVAVPARGTAPFRHGCAGRPHVDPGASAGHGCKVTQRTTGRGYRIAQRAAALIGQRTARNPRDLRQIQAAVDRQDLIRATRPIPPAST